MPRRTPYTQAGIRRVPCARCGRASRYQWNICALGNTYHGLCTACDVLLNRMMLDFVHHPQAEQLAADYAAEALRQA